MLCIPRDVPGGPRATGRPHEGSGREARRACVGSLASWSGDLPGGDSPSGCCALRGASREGAGATGGQHEEGPIGGRRGVRGRAARRSRVLAGDLPGLFDAGMLCGPGRLPLSTRAGDDREGNAGTCTPRSPVRSRSRGVPAFRPRERLQPLPATEHASGSRPRDAPHAPCRRNGRRRGPRHDLSSARASPSAPTASSSRRARLDPQRWHKMRAIGRARALPTQDKPRARHRMK